MKDLQGANAQIRHKVQELASRGHHMMLFWRRRDDARWRAMPLYDLF
jgi:hypothetical protein